MPSSIYSDHKSHKNSKSHDEYVYQMDIISDNNIIVLDLYTKSNIKIKHECVVCGFIWKSIPNNMIKKKISNCCPKCNKIHTNNAHRKTQLTYTKQVNKRHNGSILVCGQYITSKLKLTHSCVVCTHTWDAVPNLILKGTGCKKCFNKRQRKTNLKYISELNIITKTIKPIEIYKGTNKKIKHECDCCGLIWTIMPNKTLGGRGCPECTKRKQTSSGERELQTFIKNNFKNYIIFNDRIILNPKELDIYIPELKIAFEYNGDYWHQEGIKKPIGYHQDKTDRCIDKGIKLLHIWESDWRSDKKLWQQKILAMLNS